MVVVRRWFILLILVAVSVAGCGSSKEAPAAETLTVTVYFGNSQLNPSMEDCSRVFPVERTVPDASNMAEAALIQLFAGPTETEKAEGYNSWFSEETASILISLRVEGDTAYLNLTDIRPIIPSASSSCGSAAFFAEVESTLKAVLPIERVIYAIQGDPVAFYEWMQIGCDEYAGNCDPAPFADQ